MFYILAFVLYCSTPSGVCERMDLADAYLFTNLRDCEMTGTILSGPYGHFACKTYAPLPRKEDMISDPNDNPSL